MPADVKYDRAWRHFMETGGIGDMAVRQGLRRAGARALLEVGENFDRGGRPKWRPLTEQYRRRKMAGRAAPGQLPSSYAGRADLMLTGNLRSSATWNPRVRLGKNYIEFRTAAASRNYARAVNRRRKFYFVPRVALGRVAEEFAIGFSNVCNGVPDPVGRNLG